MYNLSGLLSMCIEEIPRYSRFSCGIDDWIKVSQLTFMGNMPINESRFDSKKICDYFGWEKSRWNVKLEREIINLYFAWQEYDKA